MSYLKYKREPAEFGGLTLFSCLKDAWLLTAYTTYGKN